MKEKLYEHIIILHIYSKSFLVSHVHIPQNSSVLILFELSNPHLTTPHYLPINSLFPSSSIQHPNKATVYLSKKLKESTKRFGTSMALSFPKVALSTFLSLASIWVMKSFFQTQSLLTIPIPFILFLAPLLFSNAAPNSPPGPVALPIFGNWLQVCSSYQYLCFSSLT